MSVLLAVISRFSLFNLYDKPIMKTYLFVIQVELEKKTAILKRVIQFYQV